MTNTNKKQVAYYYTKNGIIRLTNRCVSSTCSQVFPGRSLKVPWNNPILAKDSTYPIQEEWNISNAM